MVEPTHPKNMQPSHWIMKPKFRGENAKKYLSCHHPENAFQAQKRLANQKFENGPLSTRWAHQLLNEGEITPYKYGQLGWNNPYEWSYGPLLITATGQCHFSYCIGLIFSNLHPTYIKLRGTLTKIHFSHWQSDSTPQPPNDGSRGDWYLKAFLP